MPLTDRGGHPDMHGQMQSDQASHSGNAVLLAGTSDVNSLTSADSLLVAAAPVIRDREDSTEAMQVTEVAEDVERELYTPKLEFDGIAVQMGYFDGFFPL